MAGDGRTLRGIPRCVGVRLSLKQGVLPANAYKAAREREAGIGGCRVLLAGIDAVFFPSGSIPSSRYSSSASRAPVGRIGSEDLPCWEPLARFEKVHEALAVINVRMQDLIQHEAFNIGRMVRGNRRPCSLRRAVSKVC